ncbi:MAG: tRNA 4-thiouridine(8) synthase ThiI [Promethearchaeota archaeon]|nr:MAG: tRNA 4-thiouridine(8) synthase ThiI [Candidatus Lokiarchaeota archaeon]
MDQGPFEFLLIRYGEMSLKSYKVRRKLEDILINRIQQMMRRKNVPFQSIKLHPARGRFFLYTRHLDAAMEELQKCFGIISMSPAFKVPAERKLICEASLKLAEKGIVLNQSFAVKTKRVGQHSFSSQDISAEIGAYLLDNLKDRGISVNLSNPDYTLYIEIRDKDVYIFDKIIPGIAGLPYGSQGKLISLHSGGIDSPVSAWFMMKRGCDIFPLYCDLHPYTDDASYERVIQTLQKIFLYSPYSHFTFYMAPHGEALEKIKDIIPPKLTCIFCKRIMYKIAQKLASQLGAQGLTSGENLGQVASQTLDNLFVLNQAISIPIYRPLIGFDKNEIIDLSKRIGVYESSILPVTSCGAVPQYPETHGVLNDILQIEKRNQIDKIVEDEFHGIKQIKISVIPDS